MRRRHRTTRWTVIFVALVAAAAWLLLSRNTNEAGDTGLASLRTRFAAASELPPDDARMAVISIDEYSGDLLTAAIPLIGQPEPFVHSDTVYVTSSKHLPEPGTRVLILRYLRTQFTPYRSWTFAAAALPFAIGLTDALSDVREVWSGTESQGPQEIVQNDNRLLQSDVAITAVDADGTVQFTYGGQTYTLAPDSSLRFVAVRPPNGGPDDVTWLDAEPINVTGDIWELTPIDEWLADHLAQGYTDTAFTVTNHGLIPQDNVRTGFNVEYDGWPDDGWSDDDDDDFEDTP